MTSSDQSEVSIVKLKVISPLLFDSNSKSRSNDGQVRVKITTEFHVDRNVLDCVNHDGVYCLERVNKYINKHMITW